MTKANMLPFIRQKTVESQPPAFLRSVVIILQMSTRETWKECPVCREYSLRAECMLVWDNESFEKLEILPLMEPTDAPDATR